MSNNLRRLISSLKLIILYHTAAKTAQLQIKPHNMRAKFKLHRAVNDVASAHQNKHKHLLFKIQQHAFYNRGAHARCVHCNYI
jgi:hypothetical protein